MKPSRALVCLVATLLLIGCATTTAQPEPVAPEPVAPEPVAEVEPEPEPVIEPEPVAEPEPEWPGGVEPISAWNPHDDPRYPELDAWVADRVARVAAGEPERVRLPIVFRETGWGCRCPETAYIGLMTDSQQGTPWLDLTYADGVEAPEVDEEMGLVVLAIGHFTGKQTTQDLRYDEDGPDAWLYTLEGFEVERLEPYDESNDEHRLLTLVP